MARQATAPVSFGLMAEFDSAEELLTAATAVGKAGYTRTDAYSPFPIHGLAETLGFKEHLVPKIILAGGITGLLAGVGLEYYTQVIAYPMNIAGRPYWAWGAYIPPAFETTILFGSFAAVIGMLALNGLPRPYHPVFNAPHFDRASQDKFFLVIEASDPKFNLDSTRAFLTSLHPREVVEVED